MLINRILSVILLVNYIGLCYCECENACSGHGSCIVYDMCMCYRNWQGNDCNERICEFGPAFVDVPKGDLDSSNSLDNADEVLITNSLLYPYGTTEQFPAMRDSNNQLLYQTAHEYAECSNAGICNKQTGVCECFPGFTGAACQRMTCPGTERECSGHGICQSLKNIARKNDDSEYKLWDKNLIHGCICDPGFYGYDCSMRRCKQGLDPLYLDDIGTTQIPTYFFGLFSTSGYNDLIGNGDGNGYYRLEINDENNKIWLTRPITIHSTCNEIIDALENIPNNVIPKGLTRCYRKSFINANPLNPYSDDFSISYNGLYRKYFSGIKNYELDTYPAIQTLGFSNSYDNHSINNDILLTGDLYLLQLFGNIGKFNQPKINTNLVDGNRPSIVNHNGDIVSRIWSNGMQSESIDYFADLCDDVLVQVKESEGQYFFWGQTWTKDNIIKCIRTSDYNENNNVLLNNMIEWDYGSIYYPHIVRLKRNTGDNRDGGWYVVFVWDPTIKNFDAGSGERFPADIFDGAFRILHPFRSLEGDDNTLYSLYTTNGTIQMIGNNTEAFFDFGVNKIYTTNITNDINNYNNYDNYYNYGDVSCESYNILSGINSDQSNCLDKNNLFFLIDPINSYANPSYLNMYTVKSIKKIKNSKLNTINSVYNNYDNIIINNNMLNITSYYRKNVITTDIHTNWAHDASGSGNIHIYKFTPDEDSSYHYISECSNRGLCNTFEGLCECFHGYTHDDCSIQDTITQ